MSCFRSPSQPTSGQILVRVALGYFSSYVFSGHPLFHQPSRIGTQCVEDWVAGPGEAGRSTPRHTHARLLCTCVCFLYQPTCATCIVCKWCGVYEPFQDQTEKCCLVVYGVQCEFLMRRWPTALRARAAGLSLIILKDAVSINTLDRTFGSCQQILYTFKLFGFADGIMMK